MSKFIFCRVAACSWFSILFVEGKLDSGSSKAAMRSILFCILFFTGLCTTKSNYVESHNDLNNIRNYIRQPNILLRQKTFAGGSDEVHAGSSFTAAAHINASIARSRWKRTILVTGGCGFFGSAVVDFLTVKYKHDLTVVLDRMDECASLENIRGPLECENFVFIKGDVSSRLNCCVPF
jgi:hypothetical protein